MRVLIPLLAVMSACSTVSAPTSPPAHNVKRADCTRESALTDVDPRVAVFTEEFFKGARDAGAACYRAHSISFQPSKEVQKVALQPNSYILGYCTSEGYIVLNQDAWESQALIKNKAVLFHELGHCVFLLDHAPEDSVNLMAPSIPDPVFLSENWQEMLIKLFQKSLSLGATPDVFFHRHTMY